MRLRRILPHGKDKRTAVIEKYYFARSSDKNDVFADGDGKNDADKRTGLRKGVDAS